MLNDGDDAGVQVQAGGGWWVPLPSNAIYLAGHNPGLLVS